MRTLVTGSFCSGKTTLCETLRDEFGLALLPDYCRDVLDVAQDIDWSLPSVRAHLFVNQLVLEKRIEAPHPGVVIDGGIISNLAHDRVHLGGTPEDRHLLMNSVGHKRYDLVLFCSIQDVQLVDDGQRDTNPAHRQQLHSEIAAVLEELKYDAVILRGDPGERLRIAMDEIDRSAARR